MAKLSPCFKRTFVFFNSLFAILGIIIFSFALFMHHQFVEEKNGMYAVIVFYVIGGIVFAFAVLGAYGANKESKCALIVFFCLMCLATAGTLRVAVPVATSRSELISTVRTQLNEVPLNKNTEHTFEAIQANLHCCGIFKGYSDWNGIIPASCDCVEPQDPADTCEMTSDYSRQFYSPQINSGNRKVWSKPCGPIILSYVDKVLTISMGLFFGLAVLAVIGGLLSLSMIIRISAPEQAQLPSFPLTYQPPKYSEVMNY